MKYLKVNGHCIFVQTLFKPVCSFHDIRCAYFWLWRRCFLRVSPKPSTATWSTWHLPYSGVGAFLWISPEPSSVYPRVNSMKLQFCLNFVSPCCMYLWPIARFCPNSWMFYIKFGCLHGHSVSNTFVQLTEGRSARDQPKQPASKKKSQTSTRLVCSVKLFPDFLKSKLC